MATDMNIKMQFAEIPEKLTHTKWDLSFIGLAIDERGEKALEYITLNSSSVVSFEYIPKEFKARFDSEIFDKDDIVEYLADKNGKKVLIDSTTLNFAEILILTQALKEVGLKDLEILYVEPVKYKHKNKGIDILHKRDFELSEGIIGYEAIPGHALLVTNEITQKVVFLCGFEAERIDRALEDSQINGTNCSCIFGVPAFSPGFEMDSFDNNISVIKERKISGGINFCGATNPLAVMHTLDEMFKGLDEDEQLFVVPLATKPMNIGACLFLLNKPKDKVAVLYDHPKEIKGKAIEIASWHLFNISLS
jgi:hypothetical protein